MTLATWLLLAMAALGATDMLVYHAFAHGIRRHPDARSELLSHALRGPTYAALFVLIPNVRMDGGWFGALVALLAFDLAISIWDFSVESASRRALGGLPPGEYLLHVLLAILFGAFCTAILLLEGRRASLPTAIAWEPVAGVQVARILLALGAPVVLASGFLDWRARSRLGRA